MTYDYDPQMVSTKLALSNQKHKLNLNHTHLAASHYSRANNEVGHTVIRLIPDPDSKYLSRANPIHPSLTLKSCPESLRIVSSSPTFL